MSSASDRPRYPAGPGGPTGPGMRPARRSRALSGGEFGSADSGDFTEDGAGGPGTGYQVPGAMAETSTPSADSWFTPNETPSPPQGTGQQPQWQGGRHHTQDPSRGQYGRPDLGGVPGCWS